MKKNIFLTAALLFGLCTQVNAQAVKWFSAEKPKIQVESYLAGALKQDLSTGPVLYGLCADADFKELAFDGGISATTNRFDFTTNVSYMPTFFNCFRFGVGAGYHVYRYFSEFTENDFLVSARFKWCRKELFSWELAGGYMFKLAEIDALKPYKSNLTNHTYFLELLFNWHINEHFNVYCSAKSHDYFDYPLLGTPFFKSGVEFIVKDKVGFNVEMTLKFMDMFTSAVYLSECIIKTGVRMYF